MYILTFYEDVSHYFPVIQQQKIDQSESFPPRKVSISKPFVFNVHENEAAKFTFFLWLAAGARAAPTTFYLQLKVIFCYMCKLCSAANCYQVEHIIKSWGWLMLCCRFKEILTFQHYIYLISLDSVIMVPHSPDHQKLRESDERIWFMAWYIGSLWYKNTLKLFFMEQIEEPFLQ